jgi:antitoxin component of RelBE/YafQ-DinJ toxin-antitoxin module
MVNEVRHMAKTETIRARVGPELMEEAEAVLKALGLNASEAIT